MLVFAAYFYIGALFVRDQKHECNACKPAVIQKSLLRLKPIREYLLCILSHSKQEKAVHLNLLLANTQIKYQFPGIYRKQMAMA